MKIKCTRCDYESEVDVAPRLTDQDGIYWIKFWWLVISALVSVILAMVTFETYRCYVKSQTIVKMIADPTIKVTYKQGTSNTPEVLEMNR